MSTLRQMSSAFGGLVLGAILMSTVSMGTARADVTVTVDPATITNAYMNVFNLPGDGGAFQFGTGWGLADLTGVYSGSNLTLGPNTIGDPNEYWYKCVGAAVPPNCGGPGAPGNKIMEANAYAEPAGSLPGQTVTFIGNVQSNTLTSAHTVTAFVKDFAPDFSSFNVSSIALPASGPFSVSLATRQRPRSPCAVRIPDGGSQRVGHGRGPVRIGHHRTRSRGSGEPDDVGQREVALQVGHLSRIGPAHTRGRFYF